MKTILRVVLLLTVCLALAGCRSTSGSFGQGLGQAFAMGAGWSGGNLQIGR